MVKVKVCGITNLEDARASVEAGAYALGFNFYPKSPRYIEPVHAAEIIEQLPESLLTVGVFVNEPDKESLEAAARTARVVAVQLHGDETPSFCESLNRWFVIKALRVHDEFEPVAASMFETEAILLDSFSNRVFGGSGKVFNWDVARRTSAFAKKLFLAGGLNATNVRVAIEAVRPFAVDVCSGVESSPGHKDLEKLSAFMNATRKAHQ